MLGRLERQSERGYRLPPPFRESVANRPNAGDLTRWRLPTYSCGTVLDSHQLRRVLVNILLGAFYAG
jgi:hypothetical protein